MTADREQTRRDADSQIAKNLRILKLAREDQGWALSRILLAERLEREAASVPALVEALRPFTEWNLEKEPSPLPPVTLLVFREAQERARAALSVYEQSQGNTE